VILGHSLMRRSRSTLRHNRRNVIALLVRAELPNFFQYRAQEILAAQIAVLLRDVSRHGIGLDVPELLVVRSAVLLKTVDCLIFGTIQYCQPHTVGYKAGIHIDEIFFRDADVHPDPEQKVPAGFAVRSKRIQ